MHHRAVDQPGLFDLGCVLRRDHQNWPLRLARRRSGFVRIADPVVQPLTIELEVARFHRPTHAMFFTCPAQHVACRTATAGSGIVT